MFRFLMLLIILFIIHSSWPFIEKQIDQTQLKKGMDHVSTEITQLKDNPEVKTWITSFYDGVQQTLKQLGGQLKELPIKPQQDEGKKEDKVELQVPTTQVFSIHNVELGEPKEEIEKQVGAAKRTSLNEYQTNWYSYHDNYQNFFMVMYDEKNQAAALYTDQDLIASKNGIKLGSGKEEVRTKLGKPLTKMQKGLIFYQLNENDDYDLFLLDQQYVTVFYDKHENNTVTAIQIISKQLEQKKQDIYPKPNTALKEGFEYQLFDLTNAARVNHKLPTLTWDQHVRETARKHSTDMAVNQYFDHTNLEGQSPFDRMKEDQIFFHLAGENLAYGQFSSIFAHEGLMNSLGHRENILKNGYEYLGVGVAFNHESQPYFTENFYAK
ncbi:CAP domain-containing protein [Neobacillus jeddahensis]|uniref:CAP domain-containing protein n=1 Tax=Neobacillus jeddahensis TaxID=1461580 RepID=UPI00058ED6D3|nr:CAP-associated domain-containing protein [Neobacillus jeddahensis]